METSQVRILRLVPRNKRSALFIHSIVLFCAAFAGGQAHAQRPSRSTNAIPRAIEIRIVKAEDERRWDRTLLTLLRGASPKVRARAGLATGRIGNEQAIPALAGLLRNDKDQEVRAMAAFAIGEV